MSNDKKLYLTKRSNGYYYVGYFDNNRLRWKTTQQKTKPEALDFLKSFSPKTEDNKEPLTLTSLFAIYTQLHGIALRAKTLALYDDAVTEFISIVGDKLLSTYTPQDIESYKQKLLSNKLAPTTVNIRYRAVKSVFGFAVTHEHLMKSPFAKTAFIKIAQRAPLYLTREDVQKLLAKVKNTTLKDLFLFAALTGMRLAEITNLKWSAIDFKTSQIVVKNDDSFTTKSGKERAVPIHSLVLEVLKRRAAHRKSAEYVFSKSSGYKLSESYVSHQFKFYVTKAQIDERLHFHSLRHTTASHLVNAGVSIYEVQKLLGHSSVATSMIYSHLAPSRLAESINKIEL